MSHEAIRNGQIGSENELHYKTESVRSDYFRAFRSRSERSSVKAAGNVKAKRNLAFKIAVILSHENEAARRRIYLTVYTVIQSKETVAVMKNLNKNGIVQIC